MSKKNKKQSLPEAQATAQREREKQVNASFKKTRRAIWGFAILLIIALVSISTKNILVNYYYAFVLRSGEVVSEALENLDALSYTTDEKAPMQPLQEEWDSYRNARLQDTITVQSEDGTSLSGYYYDNGSEVTVVNLHSYTSSADGDFLYIDAFSEYNLLCPFSRTYGSSRGSACTFGYLEQQDLAAWLNWLNEAHPDQTVVLVGEDLGAVTALMASESGLLPDNVAFIVADSPYTNLKEIGTHTLKTWYKLPKAFAWLMGKKINSGDNGFTVADADALTAAGSGTTPVLFLAGTANKLIPEEETQAVYDAWGGEKQLYTCDSRNGLIYAENTEAINSLISSFIAQYIP